MESVHVGHAPRQHYLARVEVIAHSTAHHEGEGHVLSLARIRCRTVPLCINVPYAATPFNIRHNAPTWLNEVATDTVVESEVAMFRDRGQPPCRTR